LLDPVLSQLDGPVVDLRSGSYAGLGTIPGAVTVRVLTERPDGTRTVVSHHNKASKGRLARLLAGSRAEPNDLGDLLRLIRRAGLSIERSDRAGVLDLIIAEFSA
jgi:hypothetical protein